MRLEWIDWSIIAALLLSMTVAANYTKRYNRSVADFLAANRCARRYVLAVSEGAACIGAISVVAMFEAYYSAGFSFVWWGLLLVVINILISCSGWVQYRFRETRALTMAQFLEMRYSKRFRIYTGLIAFTSGILNFGIFPAVGARFFKHFAGFPTHEIAIIGLRIDLTYVAIILVLLGKGLPMDSKVRLPIITTWPWVNFLNLVKSSGKFQRSLLFFPTSKFLPCAAIRDIFISLIYIIRIFLYPLSISPYFRGRK